MTTPSNVGADASRGHTPDAPPIVLELWAYGAPNSGVNDRTVIDRAADTITELLEALEDSLPELVALLTHLDDAPALEAKIAKARAAIAKARTPAGETK